MNIKDIQNTAQYTKLVYDRLIECWREYLLMENGLEGETRPVERVQSVGVNHVLEQQLREREDEVRLYRFKIVYSIQTQKHT